MENIKYTLVVLSLLTSLFSQSQIVGGESPKEEGDKGGKTLVKNTKNKERRVPDGKSALYFNTNFSNTNRSLVSNPNLFGKDLGERANEKSANFWSFGLGFRNEINKSLQFSAGLGFMRNGEKYNYRDTDSSFNYMTTYRYISMPLVLNYTYGKQIQFYVGAGLVPQMTLKYTQNQDWENAQNTKSTNLVKLKGTDSGFNAFVISGIFNVGIQLKYSEFWSIYLAPELRYQFVSSYSKNSPYVHRATAVGCNLGLTYQL